MNCGQLDENKIAAHKKSQLSCRHSLKLCTYSTDLKIRSRLRAHHREVCSGLFASVNAGQWHALCQSVAMYICIYSSNSTCTAAHTFTTFAHDFFLSSEKIDYIDAILTAACISDGINYESSIKIKSKATSTDSKAQLPALVQIE